MKKKILLIDNNDSFTYNLAELIKVSGGTDPLVIKYSEIKPGQLKMSDKIIISPGPGVPAEYPLLKKIILDCAGEKPLLGVCLGHQTIAEVFGAEIINLKQVRHGISKKTVIVSKDDYLFKNVKKNFKAGYYHSWAVSDKNFPETLKVTSMTEDGIISSLSHKIYDIIGVQFHPESFITESGQILLKNWIEN